jgi:hypothetical protein
MHEHLESVETRESKKEQGGSLGVRESKKEQERAKERHKPRALHSLHKNPLTLG